MHGYTDDHTLLKTIPQMSDRCTTTAQINPDLNVLCTYINLAILGISTICYIELSLHKTFLLMISLKSDISEYFWMITIFTNSFGFTFDAVVKMILWGYWLMVGQLHRFQTLMIYPSFTSHGWDQQLNMCLVFLLLIKFYCLTAHVLKVCRTPGPTACSKIKMLRLDKVCLKS